jgi:hypothetical protein
MSRGGGAGKGSRRAPEDAMAVVRNSFAQRRRGAGAEGASGKEIGMDSKRAKLTWLAHFQRANGSLAGGQEIKAADREEAEAKGTRAAERLGLICTDITGPDEDEEPEEGSE